MANPDLESPHSNRVAMPAGITILKSPDGLTVVHEQEPAEGLEINALFDKPHAAIGEGGIEALFRLPFESLEGIFEVDLDIIGLRPNDRVLWIDF